MEFYIHILILYYSVIKQYLQNKFYTKYENEMIKSRGSISSTSKKFFTKK